MALKFISKRFLDSDDSYPNNFLHEINCLKKCRNTNWCVNLYEVLNLPDCFILVTELILGLDLFMFRATIKLKLYEEEGRNIIQKVTMAVKDLQDPIRNIYHRDLH